MKKLYLLCCIALLGSKLAHAEVLVEKTCWTHASRGGSDKTVNFVLQTYKDTLLDKEVGGFIQYEGSKKTIPVVFKSFVLNTDDDQEPGNYELTRTEVIDGKIGGEYVFALVGMGIKRGEMATYRKTKTSKPFTFYNATKLDGTCAFKVD